MVFALLLMASSAFAERDFDEAVQLAAANAESPAGRDYAPEAAARFQLESAAQVRQCLTDHAARDLLRYRIVARIDESGGVEQVWQTPVTPADACVAGVLQDARFRKPPFAPFHVLLQLEPS
jgi:hypothetical protein